MYKHAIVYFYYFFFVYRTTESLKISMLRGGGFSDVLTSNYKQNGFFLNDPTKHRINKAHPPQILRPYRHPQVNRQYGRNTPPRREPGTLCYHQGGRGVGGQPLEMLSAFEGRRSTRRRGGVTAWGTQHHRAARPDARAHREGRAERGDAPLSQPRGKRHRRTNRSAESGKRQRAVHSHRINRNTSPPFPQLGKRRPRAPGGAAVAFG